MEQFLSIIGRSADPGADACFAILNQFMAVLIGWAQTFAAVVSALFGKKVDTAANAMSGAASSADSLAGSTAGAAAAQDDLAGSTADANKELKDQIKNFSGLDEINTFSVAAVFWRHFWWRLQWRGCRRGNFCSWVIGEIGQGVTISPELQNTIDTVQDWFDNVQKARSLP